MKANVFTTSPILLIWLFHLSEATNCRPRQIQVHD